VVAGALALVGCAAPGDEVETNPILLVGFDGFEWSVALPMVRDGELPNLRRLMERGTWGRLRSFAPGESPTLWTSAATGMAAERHGILGFVKKKRNGESERALYTSADRDVPAFWNILSERGRRVAVIGWWNTFPAEAVEGVVVAQANTLGAEAPEESRGQKKGALLTDREGQVFPPERAPEFLAVVPLVVDALPETVESIFGELPTDLPPVPASLWKHCLWSVRADATYRAIAGPLLRDERFDVFAVYFGGSDVIGHRFWRYMDPDSYDHPPEAEEIELLGDLIPAYYRHLDRMLGELLAVAPPDSNVMVLSDHGMVPARTSARYDPNPKVSKLLSADHEKGEPGVLVAAGPDIVATGPDPDTADPQQLPELGSVLDITPTLLALQRLPVGRDMDGTVLEQLFDPGFLPRAGIEFVDSLTPPDWAERRAGDGLATPESEERLEQLRSLGYVE